MIIKKSKNQKALILEQNTIKKGSECLAVYDLPSDCVAFTFITEHKSKNYTFITEYKNRAQKLFIFRR